MAVRFRYLQRLWKQIDEAAQKEVIEKVMCNNLSAIELQTNKFDEEFREDVYRKYQREKEEEEGAKGLRRISFTQVKFDECFEHLGSILIDGWLDPELRAGSLVVINHFFGNMPRTTVEEDANVSDKDPSPYVIFLGWKEETIDSLSLSEFTEGRTKRLKTFTQHWLWGEKIFVQNLPVTCYVVIRNGTDDGTVPPFWNPTQEFL